jgi:hypothetical protein
VAGAFLVVAFTVVAAAVPSARAAEHGKDWQHALQVVANLRQSHGRKPVVVLLGGSSARECTVSDVAWARQIRRRSGIDTVTYNAGSKHRTYSEDLALVRLLPRNGKTLVYIGVNLGRFCLGVTPAAVRLPRARPLPLHRQQHVYSSDHILSASAKRSYVSYWLDQRYPNFLANYANELAVLERIILACKRRSLHVALVDLPRDLPAIGETLDAAVGRYHGGCSRLAARYHIAWLTFCASCGFKDDDFFDLFHLVEPGRTKYQSVLTNKTIRLLERYGMTTAESGNGEDSTASPSPSPVESSSAARPSQERGTPSTPERLLIATAVVLAVIGLTYRRRRRAT